MSSCMELVERRILNYLPSGHIKLAPDLFSKIASAYHKLDVFNENDLQLAAEPYGAIVIDHGSIVRTWRSKVGKKYINLPGIRALHDFLQITLMKVREKCYAGAL